MLSEEHLDSLMAQEPSPRYLIGSRPNILLRTHELRVSRDLRRIAKYIRTILETDEPLYSLNHRDSEEPTICATFMGQQLVETITRRLPEFEEYFPCNALNPYIELLREAVRSQPAVIEACRMFEHVKGMEAQQIVLLLAQFTADLRQRGRAKDFLADLDARRRQCQKNQASAIKYSEAIFNYRTSRILAVRLDVANGAEDPERRGITTTVSADQARVELDRLIRHIRDNFPLAGWMGNFEYGMLTGYHFHLLLYFDGHKVSDGVAIARTLGEMWVNEITEGRGRYFNCNVLKYAHNGIGMISHNDKLKRDTLYSNVLPYLTKTDFWLKFEGTRKTFFRGQMPSEAEKRAKAAAGGRPRKPMKSELERPESSDDLDDLDGLKGPEGLNGQDDLGGLAA